jgi:hypothetical protein
MATMSSVGDVVEGALRDFLTGLGRDVPEFADTTDLIRATGCTSDDGIDFALDLEERGFDVPKDFNPFVHESGNRGMRLGELVERVGRFAQTRR